MTADAFMNALCRGLVGYVSYLAPCRQSEVYSEYLLYEPIARIAQAQGWRTRAEVPVNAGTHGKGDFERIDFQFTRNNKCVALEVKWAKSKTCKIQKDVRKLKSIKADYSYVLVFGSGAVMKNIRVVDNGEALNMNGMLVQWDAGKTHYGARWLRIPA